MNYDGRGSAAVPLWPTPWYLRLLGYKRWRYRQLKKIFDPEYAYGVEFKLMWIYVDSVHEIVDYKPIPTWVYKQ